ncbi:DnaJ -like protein subfamily B member 4 [Babesia sp. Xinjiang]|uniref:DnaJ -like protein subfamily B member 4 n=1 Tax=Babesia sp. Xinjiang TaxID=462227 RepID=UPI000A23A20D|nr:DnaJ -like protein subfamily B member 4 [Babesia sp. Xinjiang]XP_028871421.1 DnaJ -like protein subfamily B member 4 [Babesia sp. Xinjiang]ORM40870.1 DnaJ -like protein subfamily B member 4 [Babesia sp. Xinjiang]ORM40965.1 DnaJ -like protein subfamily B member 4 [Babesia sp. Xinjiang]
MGQDYYAILGVNRGCNDAELKKAYRKLAMQWHPDKHPDPAAKQKAEDMFKNVSEAYDVLSDPEKRKIYDQFGEEGLKGTAGTQGHSAAGHQYVYTGVDPTELFKKFFGADRGFMFNGGFGDDMGGFSEAFGMPHGARQRCQKSPNYELDLPVTLEELYTGTVKKMKITRKRFANGGEYKEEQILKIDIKPGWKDGTKLTFSGEGDQAAPGSPPGDLIFIIRAKPHPRFVRDGNNLVYKFTVPLVKALTGFQATLTTLDNRRLTTRIVDVVSPSYRKVIPNEGMPISKSPSHRGDLILEFDVTFPRVLTAEQKKQMAAALNETG